MTERERLRELIYAWEFEESKVSIADCDTDKSFERLVDKLLAAGVIVPPCKVGERLYEIVKMPKHTFISEFPMISEPYQVIYRNIIGGYSCIPFEKIGKTVFLTRDEAEKALAERSNDGKS